MRALLADRPFALLFTARTISVLGTGFGRVALAFAVLALPGASPTKLSVVLACQALPQLVLILAGGVIGDRFPRRRVLLAAELFAGVAWTGLALMFLTGQAPLTAVCVFAALAGVASAAFLPAYDGVVPDLVPPERRQDANGLLRIGFNLGLILGLSLAGTTVALFGAGWAVTLNAASFFVSAALIAGIRRTGSAAPRPPASVWSELRRGWREFSSRQWLWAVVAQYAFVVAAINAYVGVFGPLLTVEGLGGAQAWSAITAAQAAGTFLGVGIAVRIHPRRPVLVAALVTAVAALPMALLAAATPLPVVVAAAFLAGVAGDIFGVLWSTTMQREVPAEALSRVSSWDLLGSLSFAPLGLLVAGPIAGLTGTPAALWGCAALVVLATAGAALAPGVRGLRAPAHQPVQRETAREQAEIS
ncbi:MFS transporter [Asanoa iriomotensis]|uniref:MFS transporter n=1 Tax=Asanoa iriomotensis TaxID=234613 RepID=A0ABQ4CBF2_9ACTN|nr:MFS transporter [Asanoa iriomotensis]GIF60106.1 MFS transporter [Asanoa iriomotensis]